MRDPLMHGIPLILETPAPEKALEYGDLAIWTREIKLLYEIQTIGDDEWATKKVEIEKRWREERDKINPPKEKVKKPKKEKKGKKGKMVDDEAEDDDDDEMDEGDE